MPTQIANSRESAALATEKVLFYGASRFECPEPGHAFRHRDGRVLSVVAIKKEFLGYDPNDLSRPSWRFIAECRPLTPREFEQFGK